LYISWIGGIGPDSRIPQIWAKSKKLRKTAILTEKRRWSWKEPEQSQIEFWDEIVVKNVIDLLQPGKAFFRWTWTSFLLPQNWVSWISPNIRRVSKRDDKGESTGDVQGLTIIDCARRRNSTVPKFSKVSAIDVTAKTFFERLYLILGLASIGALSCPCCSNPHRLNCG